MNTVHCEIKFFEIFFLKFKNKNENQIKFDKIFNFQK